MSNELKGVDDKVVERFWTRVNKNGPAHPSQPELGPCWVWTVGVDKDGYGKFQIPAGAYKQIHVRAHRFSFAIAIAREPVGPLLHSCDRPSCVNPGHLREGTTVENMAEAMLRGSKPSGGRAREKGPKAFTWTLQGTIDEIRRMHASGMTVAQCARATGTKYMTTRNIVLGVVSGRRKPPRQQPAKRLLSEWISRSCPSD